VTATIYVAAASRRGYEHAINEDAIGLNGCAVWSSSNLVFPPPGSQVPYVMLEAPAAIVVADGVSGTTDAHTAALLTAETASGWFRRTDEVGVREGLAALHRELVAFGRRRGESNESGSTVAGLVVRPDGALVLFHVGDSRVYHSEVTSLVHTEDDVAPLPMSDERALARWLGKRDEEMVSPHVRLLPPSPWRRALLCTDGYAARLGDQQIERMVLRSQGPGQPSPRPLTSLVPELMAPDSLPGRDDETAVLVDVYRAPEIGLPAGAGDLHQAGEARGRRGARSAGRYADRW
jgi:serine/threonine protein phosphatase PrpC